MKIIFVVNTTGLTGGIKAIFKHAQNLASFGHQIEIIHLLKLKKTWPALLIAILKKIKYCLILPILGIKPTKWFGQLNNIKIKRWLKLKGLKNFDCLIATANETADFINELPIDKEKKFYFIQDYETWTRDKNLVDKTYKMPLKKIVISSYLKNLLLKKFNEPSIGPGLIGFDPNEFTCSNNRLNKNITILMQYHVLPKKGITYGLEALAKIKKEFPHLKIKMFGPYKLKDKIDFDFEYFYKPPQKKLIEIFCSTDIFLFPSLEEGFGAPPLEAMAAGCAVIATKVGAISDYAENNKNIILVEPGNSYKLYDAIKELILNPTKLKLLQDKASKNITIPTWLQASRNLEKILSNNKNPS
jgi:hypothetical protein